MLLVSGVPGFDGVLLCWNDVERRIEGGRGGDAGDVGEVGVGKVTAIVGDDGVGDTGAASSCWVLEVAG